jgi:hypothetical protein
MAGTRFIRIMSGLLIAVAALSIRPAIAAQDGARDVRPATICDRACLYGFLDTYLDALEKKDPLRLPLARHARFSENSVEMAIGDGLWNTISGRGDYDLRLADIKMGSVGWYGVVYENGNPAAIALRMKVVDGLITEIETVLSRRQGDGPFPNPQPQLLKKIPIFDRIEPAETRRPRARLLSISDGYFDTLQLNDGTIFTQFDPDCNRRENGFQTTNNKDPGIPGAVLSLGCEAQFRTGNFRFDDRLRARRYPIIDEERGLVMAGGFIDHSGSVQKVKLADGRVIESLFKTPHSYCLLELFKIVDGKIRQVEAVFTDVPYNMPTPWLPGHHHN